METSISMGDNFLITFFLAQISTQPFGGFRLGMFLKFEKKVLYTGFLQPTLEEGTGSLVSVGPSGPGEFCQLLRGRRGNVVYSWTDPQIDLNMNL